MNPDDLARLLDELGKRLGPTGEHVFSLAVRQVYVEAITMIGLALLVALVVAVAARPVFSRLKRMDDDGFTAGMLGLLTLCALAAFSVLAFSHLQALLNPEYAALRMLLRMVAP